MPFVLQWSARWKAVIQIHSCLIRQCKCKSYKPIFICTINWNCYFSSAPPFIDLPDKFDILNSLDDGSSCAFTSMESYCVRIYVYPSC